MRSLDVLDHANWRPLSRSYKFTHNAFYDSLTPTGLLQYCSKEGFRACILGEQSYDLLTMPRFNTNYGKNSIRCDNRFFRSEL